MNTTTAADFYNETSAGFAQKITCPYLAAYLEACCDNADRQDRMHQAFAVVDPTCPIDLGPSAPVWDWKSPINFSVGKKNLPELLRMYGVTLEEILESVRFFTATEPTVTETEHPEPVGTWLQIRAAGYRAGPAGDH